jgi:hypothetical protein
LIVLYWKGSFLLMSIIYSLKMIISAYIYPRLAEQDHFRWCWSSYTEIDYFGHIDRHITEKDHFGHIDHLITEKISSADIYLFMTE